MKYHLFLVTLLSLSIGNVTIASHATAMALPIPSNCTLDAANAFLRYFVNWTTLELQQESLQSLIAQRPPSPYCKNKHDSLTQKPPSWGKTKKTIINAATSNDITTIQHHLLWSIFHNDLPLVRNILATASKHRCTTMLLLQPQEDGSSPLHLAASLGSQPICGELIKHGASLSTICQGKTALKVSQESYDFLYYISCNIFLATQKSYLHDSSVWGKVTEKINTLLGVHTTCLAALKDALQADQKKEAVVSEEEKKEKRRVKRQRQKEKAKSEQQREKEKKEEKIRTLEKEINSQQQECILMHHAERERARELAALAKAKKDRAYDEQLKLIREEQQRQQEIAYAKELKRRQEPSDKKRSAKSAQDSSSVKIPSLTATFLDDIENDPTIPSIDIEVPFRQLYTAAATGNCPLIKQAIIQSEFNPNMLDTLSGHTPLITAILHRQLEVVKLLAPCSNLKTLDKDGFDALQHAVECVLGQDYNPQIFFMLYNLSDKATQKMYAIPYKTLATIVRQQKQIVELKRLLNKKRHTQDTVYLQTDPF